MGCVKLDANAFQKRYTFLVCFRIILSKFSFCQKVKIWFCLNFQCTADQMSVLTPLNDGTKIIYSDLEETQKWKSAMASSPFTWAFSHRKFQQLQIVAALMCQYACWSRLNFRKRHKLKMMLLWRRNHVQTQLGLYKVW